MSGVLSFGQIPKWMYIGFRVVDNLDKNKSIQKPNDG